MNKFNPCMFCGKDYDIPEPIYSLGVYPNYEKIFSDHMDSCYMYDLWKRSNRGLMAYKEHLIEQQTINTSSNTNNRLDESAEE